MNKELIIDSIGNDQYEVISKKETGDKEYHVDMKNHYCTCKGFMKHKKCKHMDEVIARLKDNGKGIHWR